MSNDEIKKFIDHSKLYTEVDLEENKKVEEGVLDFIKGLFKSDDDAEEVIKKADPEVVKDLDKKVDDNNLSGPAVDTSAGDNAQANMRQNDTSSDTSAQGGGADAATTGVDGPADAAAAIQANPNVANRDPDATDPRGDQTNPPANKQGVDGPADAAAATQANPNVANRDPDATDPRGDQTNPPANKQGVDGPSNAAAMAAGQAGAAATTAPSNGSLLGRKLDLKTPNLMKAYNDGGKKDMPAIRNLQTALSRLGHDPNGIDGKYGNGTYAAVQAFQKANGLSVDGQAGPGTMAAIKKALDDNFEKNKVTPQDAPKAADEPQGEPTSRLDTKGETPQGDDADSDPMTAANQQKDIDTAQPNADLARYIELLNKLEGPQTVSASYDFGKLIQLVESKLLNEKLTPAEMDELKALHNKVQGHVGIPGMDDEKITTALNRYLKLVKEPAKPASATARDGGNPGGTTKAVDPDANDPRGRQQRVSNELYIQSGTSAANFNVPQMKKKYPSPYIVIPQKDGTVIHGFGKPENLTAYQKTKKGSKIVDKSTAQAAPPAGMQADRAAPQVQAGEPDAERDGAERGIQTASKDNNMKKAIKEASMNISINGDSAAEVAELAGILKNAGMHDAKPVSDIMPHAHDGHDDMVSKMRLMDQPAPDDSPCGMDEEGVEEDWDNSPDESYADHQTMTHDLSGGINRQKPKGSERVKDPAVALETSIKEQLWAALNEKMTAEGRGRGKTLKASRGEKLNASRGNKLMASRGKDKKTTEGSRGKKSRGKKSRG